MAAMNLNSSTLLSRVQDSDPPDPVVAIVGATATGKSDLAVELARRINGEIVNADAMQLYRGMDIGTAKVTLEERRGIEHHQLDVLDVSENASVSVYQTKARADISSIKDRDRRAVLVGGSGLYLRAALDVMEFPGTDATLRASFESRLEAEGPQALHDELRGLDPQAAAGILPANGRRVVRALEVIALTGRPFTAVLPTYEYHLRAIQIGLTIDMEELEPRIAARVHHMWDNGLIEEVEELLGQGIAQGRTARLAVGYAQALAHLAGEISREDAIEQTIRATRRLAKRQQSWFARDPRIRWLSGADPDLAQRALDLVASLPGDTNRARH